MRFFAVAVFVAFAVTSSSCACGTGPSLVCAYATPFATGWKKVNGPLPAEGDGPSVDGISSAYFVHGGESFEAVLDFSGGPIATLRYGIENECYFEIPVHPERASQNTFDDIESDVAGDIKIAKPAVNPQGRITVEFDYSRLGSPNFLRIAEIKGQLVDTSGRVSHQESLGFLTICKADGSCTDEPEPTGGGSGGGASGGGAGGGSGGGGAASGGGGGADTLTWSDWYFLRSDQPTQYRAALTRTEGTKFFYKTEFRVNRNDAVFVSACNGYIAHFLPRGDETGTTQFSVTFSGTSMNSIAIPTEFSVDLPNFTWPPGKLPTRANGWEIGLNWIYPISAASCCRSDANCRPETRNYNGP